MHHGGPVSAGQTQAAAKVLGAYPVTVTRWMVRHRAGLAARPTNESPLFAGVIDDATRPSTITACAAKAGKSARRSSP